MISQVFAKVLEGNRAQFNAQFAEARWRNASLDGDAFLAFLGSGVAPVVEAVARVAPERVEAVVQALYPLALDLFGKELVGSRARAPLIAEGWRVLGPAMGRQVAAEPERVMGALTNALYNLSQTPGARGREWLSGMLALAPQCADVAMLLRVGQVLAWRAGLAHYRTGALALCAQLPPALARAALGVSNALTPPDARIGLDELLARVTADPWLDPATPGGPAQRRQLKIVARVGAFRGFGGLFMAPPNVASAGGQFVVLDGEACWLLTADVFGATFHRTACEAVLPAAQPAVGAFRVVGTRVTLGGESGTFPEFASMASCAAVGPTLAVTTRLSHAVYLVAVQ